MSKRTDYLDNIISGNQEANKSDRVKYLDNIIGSAEKKAAPEVTKPATTLEEERANERDKMLTPSVSRQTGKTANIPELRRAAEEMALDPNAFARASEKTSRAGDFVGALAFGTGKTATNLGGMALEGLRALNDAAYEQNNAQQRTAQENSLAYWQQQLKSAKTQAERDRARSQIDRASRALGAMDNLKEMETRDVMNAANKVYSLADDLSEQELALQERSKEGLGTVGTTLMDAGYSFAQSMMDGGIGALTGTGMLPFVARAFSGSAQEARKAGADFGQQMTYASSQAAKEYITEKLFGIALPQKVIGKAGRGGLDGVIENVIAKAVGKVESVGGQKALGGLLTWLTGGVTEGLEEGIGDFIENNILNPLLENKLPPELTTQNSKEDYLSDMLLGGISGLMGVTNLFTYSPYNAATERALEMLTGQQQESAPAAAGRAAIEATTPKTVVPAPVTPAPVQKAPDLPLASEQGEQKAQAGEITPSTADVPQNAAQSARAPIANGFNEKQMEVLSGTFGENGAKAFRTSMTDYPGNPIKGYAQFTKLYNEGKKRGKTVDTSPAEILKAIEETPELSPEQRYAAFVSGMNDASAAEIAAIASDNPLIIEQNEVSQKIATLEALSQSHAKEVSLANRKLAELPGTIARLKDVISNLKKDISARKDVSGANFTANVLGTQYTKAAEAGAAIVQASKDILDMTAEQKSAKIGDVAGLDIYVSNHSTAFIKGTGAYDFNLNTESAEGTMSSALHTIKTLDARLTAAETNLSEKEKEIEKYEKISTTPFEKQAELNKLRAREDEIMAILNPQSEQGAFDGNGEGNGDYDGEAEDTDAFVDAENSATPDRSDQWSAARVGDGKKPKRLAEIIEQIHHDFDVNITTGHIRGKNKLGQFSHGDQGIRSRIANDLPTIAHELGHYFDFTYGLTKSGLSAKLRSELTDNLSDEMKAVYKKEKHVTEGLAEFMRKFLQNRETAAIDYPELTAYFLGRLTPKDLALIEQLSDDVNAYYSLDAETATSSIRFKEEKNPDARTAAEKIKDTSDRWYQDWVDALHSIKQFDDDTGSDVYKLAINSLYKDAVAGAIITGDLTDKNGQYVSAGLKDVLRGINLKDKEEYRLFNEYLVVKHGPERLSEGKRIFADDRKNSTNWMNARAATLEAQHPQFKAAAERLYRFQKDFKKTWLVGTGLLSDEMSKDWDDRWEFYVPLNRAVDMQKRGIGAKRGFANQSNPIKRASERGSGLDIISPVDNIIDNIIRVVNAGMQNDVMLQLTNAAIRTGADATIMEKIPTPMKKTIFSLGGVKGKLNDAGDAALSEGKFDTKAFNRFDEIVSGLDDVIAQYSKGKSHDNIITVLRNGETEFWKINDPLLLSSLMNLSPARSNALLEMYGSITRFMTATATGTNVVWSITSNFPRDLQTLLVYSEGRNRLSVIPAMAKAYLNAFKKDNADPLYKEYLAMGGGQTSVYTADRNVARNMRAKLAGDKMRWLNPMEWIAFISETVESGPRYATYKLMREKGMTPQEAIYASHDITVNFRRGGVRSRELNKAIPFFNAGVQGLDKFARWQTAQDIPLGGRKSAARTRFFTFLAVNVALGALFYGINNADEEKKEDYQQLSNYTKNNYWLFPLGDGEYFAIPKARELSVIASFAETALERTAGGNKHAFDEFYDYVIDTSLPGLISDLAKGDWEGAVGTVGILGVGAYIMANRDFLGRPIESAGMQYLEAKDRYNNRTSKIAYALGQALDASPQKIDYFFQQTFGGFWKAQKALMPVGGENVDVTLGVQNQYIKDNQYSTDLVNWLYDKADASAKAKKSNPADMEKAITATMDDRMTSFYSNYNKVSKGEESTMSTRGTRQVVLTMINEYQKASDSGALTAAQKAVYAVCKQQGSTDYLPSTMQSTVKDGAGTTHTLSGVDYVEFQLNYNRLYWEYVEDNINSGKSAAEKAAICTASKSTAKANAINRIAASHGWAKTEDAEKFKGVNADAVVRFKAYLDIANDDNSLTQEEVLAAIDRLALSKEQSSTLFHSKYDSDKNNPYK